jgi:hypothetical protein
MNSTTPAHARELVSCAECSLPLGWLAGGMLPYVICNDCKVSKDQK